MFSMNQLEGNKGSDRSDNNVIHSSFNIEIDKEKHIAYFIYRRVPHGTRINNNILDKKTINPFLFILLHLIMFLIYNFSIAQLNSCLSIFC